MEKYSVDKENDKIEKRAQEMVKSGELKSIKTARDVAVKEDKATNGEVE